MGNPLDPAIKENWQYHDEYEFWYMPYPGTNEAQAEEGVRWRGFKPWEAQKPAPEEFEEWYRQNGYYHDTVSDRKELMREAWNARSPERESGELTEADKKEIVSAMDSAYRIAFLSNPTTNPFYAVLDAFLKWRKARV